MPALAPVGRVPVGRIVELPGRGTTYVVDSGPEDAPAYVLLHSVLVTLRDRAFGVRRQQWLADRIPEAETVTVEAGHAGCTLQSDKFVPGLRQAIESVHHRLPSVSHGGLNSAGAVNQAP